MERFRLHLLKNYELSESDAKVLVIWEAAYALILDDCESDRNVVRILQQRFGIDRSTGYTYIRDAKNLFGNVRASSKEALRYIVTQWSIELYRMAKQSKNLKAMESALERLTKANNLDKEDMDMPDVSKIQPPTQVLSINVNFINSPRFKLIDKEQQIKILEMYKEFMGMVNQSQLSEHADLFEIDDIDHKEGK